MTIGLVGMKEMGNQNYSKSRLQSGFTLVELLIVAIILAILAAIVVPQFSDTTEDANAGALRSNLAAIRNAVELYNVQHGNDYPGVNKVDGTAEPLPANAGAPFVDQLIEFTSATGATSTAINAANPFGPYLKGSFPANPFNGLATVTVDDEIDLANISVAGDDSSGYIFYRLLGRLIANSANDVNGVETATF